MAATINGLTIATDPVGATPEHHQFWKMRDGRTGGTDGIPGSAVEGLWVADHSGVDTVGDDAVPASTTVVTLRAANPLRRKLSIVNTSAQTLYVRCKAGASLAAFTVALPGGMNAYWEMPFNYRGIVTGIWAAPVAPAVLSGVAMVTEY